MKKLFAFLLAVCMLLSLTACGASSSMDQMENAAEAPASREDSLVSNDGLTLGSTNSTGTVPEGRKWIITVEMQAETEDLDALLSTLDAKIGDLDGYVEDQNIHNGSAYATRRYRSANLTVRIPADRVDSFTLEVEGMANVVSNNLRREDITLTYVATESRISALEAEQARLLELMAQAENMSDLLEIEARLTDVNYELERYASQLRTFDNQIDYATIYLSIEEVQEYTPVAEPTFWERLSGGFIGSLKGLAQSLLDLIVILVVAAPYALVYGGMVLVLVLLIRRVRKNKKQKQTPPQDSAAK